MPIDVKPNPHASLFKPLRIGTTELRNRIAMPAVNTQLASSDGEVTDALVRFYATRAAGGAGLIVIENTCILWPEGKAGKKPTRIDDDRFLPALHDLAEAVHLHGAKIATNLQHTGRQTSVLASTQGTPLVSASAVPNPQVGGDVPRELELDEIDRYVEIYAQAVRRTRDAGFDAAELHGAHGYLLMQFISPFTNRRTDRYGGSLENRMRFPLEVVARSRELVGDEFPLIYRMSADEGVEGGYGIEEAEQVATLLEEAGVDAFSVAAGIYESMTRIFPPASAERAPNLELSRRIKATVDVPVIVAGKLDDPDDAAAAIDSGAADAVAIARGMLAEPDWANRVAAGEVRRIRPCIYGNEGCLGDIFRGWSLQCDVNPGVNRDGPRTYPAAARRLKVLVIGGGPAGCELALTAARRGHHVRLLDRGDALGGTLLVAGRPDFRADLLRLVRFHEAELAAFGVEVESGVEVDATKVRAENADAVVLAVGRAWGGGVPGTYEVLAGTHEPIEGEVSIAGADQIACLAAWRLGAAGRRVRLALEGKEIGFDVGYLGRLELEEGLAAAGVELVEEASEEALRTAPAKPDEGLAHELRQAWIPFTTLGDAAGGTRIFDAVRDGIRVGMEL